MANTVAGVHLGPDTHANRPSATAVTAGTLYSCSDHDLIYVSDGSSWSTWATVGGPGAGGSGALTQIAQTVLASAAASISFASIPGTYETLKVVLSGRSAAAGNSDTTLVRFNGDSGTNYSWQSSIVSGTGYIASTASSATSGIAGLLPGASTSGGVGQFEILIPGYARTNFEKSAHAKAHYVSDVAYTLREVGTQWASTVAINRVDLIGNSANLAAGTVATLYGLA